MPSMFKHYSFSNEYKKNQQVLRDQSTQFAEPLVDIMSRLQSIMGDDGFDKRVGKMLGVLRYKVKTAEADTILTAAGMSNQPQTGNGRHAIKINNLNSEQIKKAAVIKMLRHLYLVHEQGGTDIWVVSTPKSYDRYFSKELNNAGVSLAAQYAKLEDIDEQFTKQQREQIGASTNEARRLVVKTIMELNSGRGNPNSRIHRLVRRWFSGESVSNAMVEIDMAKIVAGLKKVENLINSNKLIYTDMPYLRNTSNVDHKQFSKSIAFVFGSMAEKIPVIYVEEGFFNSSNSILGEKLAWANTVIHEITHLVLGTDDHRYRFEGMSPDHLLTPHQAMTNADTWSIFCLDVCNTLSQYQKLCFSYGRSLRPPAPPVPPPKISSTPPVPPPKVRSN